MLRWVFGDVEGVTQLGKVMDSVHEVREFTSSGEWDGCWTNGLGSARLWYEVQ